MVSTRGIKIKFSEGERVLCYEPDPSKTKVLYDSKVLEVIYNKDGKGKKQVEYLIHFQGWNASWDRCVTEDLVLKDTAENRELQQELASNAHIKLSMKSNRILIGQIQGKDNKRLSLSSDGEKETKKKCTGSETSSQDGQGTEETDSLQSDMEEINNTTTNEEESSDEEVYSKHIPLHVPDALKAVLERDYQLINEKNKLLNLPAKKTILAILDDYVRYFAVRYIARSKEKRKAEQKEKEKAFMTLDLCKEIVESLRVCFDHYVTTLLLYQKEMEQCELLKNAQSLHTDSMDLSQMNCSVSNEFNDLLGDKTDKDKVEIQPKRQLRSKRLLTEESVGSSDVIKDVKSSAQSNATCESGRSTPTTLTSGASANVIPTLSEIHEDILNPIHSDSNLHQQLKCWTLIPENERDPPSPIMKYGATHLLRLFVKLPHILYKMSINPEKKKYIIKHLELFLEYLNSQNQELFSDVNYINNVLVKT